MDLIGSLLIQFGTIATAVWGLLQMLPQAKSGNYKLWLSFVIGPAFGIIGHMVGLIDLGGLVPDSNITHHAMSDEARHLLAAGFLGLLSTILAKVAHDHVLDPLLAKRSTKGD
jgi:hypothetical protein